METASPIALTSVKSRKSSSPLHQHSCLEFRPVNSHVVLRTWPEYVPMVTTTPFRDQVVILQAIPSQEDDSNLTLLCPLFVCYGGQQKGKAVSKQRVSHWLVDAIRTAYQARGLPSPLGVRTHSTRGIAALAALANEASFSRFPGVNPEHPLHHLALLVVAEFNGGTRYKYPTQGCDLRSAFFPTGNRHFPNVLKTLSRSIKERPGCR
ncbi:putative iron export permease protein FetB [Labeo rohita]|uniref:Iron export permease protein FetB n=1 Tax=Labeo rohita TaxID=84645 RepID=A0ABQ8L822_LABRO|nr:putative iron export permease protein FetB [Labeo rohita]